MMEKETLRKADFFSGLAVCLLGLFIVSQGLKMPMKDSWGGVMNVWFVSPALFPLFVGAMLVLLGALLVRSAINSIGLAGVREAFVYLGSHRLAAYLREEETIRFYGIVVALLGYVFVLVPSVDFFLSSVLFLLLFFTMFYCGDHAHLLRTLYGMGAGFALLIAMLALTLDKTLATAIPFPADWLVLCYIIILIAFNINAFRANQEDRRKLRISLIIGLIAPLTIGVIFKYFLMVPLPSEGLVVALLDAIWYADFWS